ARLASWHPPVQRRRNLENSAVPTLLARGSRLAFRATMCRAEGDLEACWNRILTIFDPYTFSHSQGQGLTNHHPCRRAPLPTALPPATDLPSGASPNGALCRRMHCNKMRRRIAGSYSITSSARASTEGGTVRPSVLALLRLITNWTFVAWMTGRSAGFSPLR